MDGAMIKAPLGGKKVGKHPTDLGKIGTTQSVLTDGGGVPIGLAVEGANRSVRAVGPSNCLLIDQGQSYVRRISAVYPDLAVKTVCSGPSGQYNDTLIINQTMIFRFPRYKSVVARLPGEIAILRAIQGHVSLPIPDPVYVSRGFEAPEAAFIGYPLILGRPLWRGTLQSVDDHTLDILVTQLAVFLRGLHSVPPSMMTDELLNLDSRHRWADLYARVHEELFPHLRAEGSLAVAAHFEAFLDYAPNFEYSPAIRHGDLGPGNVLFDWASQSLTGIVDFDFAGLGDPAVDWSVVLTPCLYGEAFVRRFQRLHPVSELTLARARFYRETWAVQEALRAMEAGDQGAFQRAIAGIDQGRLCCNGPDICLASDPRFWRGAVALDQRSATSSAVWD